jgi:hypothetical protein
MMKHSPSFWNKVGNLISVFGKFLNIDTSNGNVGIGTTTPQTNLDVNGRGRFTASGVIPASGSGVEIIYTTTGRVFAYNRATSSFLPIVLGIGSQLVLESNGNVGINANPPTAKLQIKGAGTTTGINFQTLNSAGTALVTGLDSGKVGIGTVNPGDSLEITLPNQTQGGIKISNTAGANGYFQMGNITTTSNNFSPYVTGLTSTSANPGLYFRGLTSPANDTGTVPIVRFLAMQSDTTKAEVRPLYAWQGYDGGFVSYMTMLPSGNLGVGTETPNSKLQVNGSFSAGYVAKTANYTLTNTDYLVECTANTFTITLPTAVGIQGRMYNIKNTGTGVITVATTSSQTIDGQTSQTVNQWENLSLMSNNSNWIIT